MRRKLAVMASGVSLLAWPLPALSQTPAAGETPADTASAQPAAEPGQANGRIVYPVAWFATFRPANALQIVQRVPGFTLEENDDEVRGFGAAAGNVVINGQRPSSKSEPISTILSRIPANRVARVEMGAGDLFGADYSGKPQVVNLVLTEQGGLAGTVEGAVRRDFTGHVMPEGSVSALIRTGKSSFNLSATLDNDQSSEVGYDRLVALPSGAELEYRDKLNMTRDPNAALAASWAYDGGTNRTAHINVRGFIDRFQLTQNNDVYPANGPIRDDRLSQRYYADNLEIGGDVTRPFAGGGIKLIGLATRRWRTLRDENLNRIRSEVIGGSRQRTVDLSEETLARLVWSRSNWGGWNVEAGGEGVINRLDSAVDLYTLGAGGVETRIDLPVDRAVVKEYRGEGFINAGRALTPKLRVDMGLTWEYSRLTVSGDAQSGRTLQFLKPRVVLDWRPEKDWRFQMSLQRSVAQLRFEDFISSAELANDRVNGGNADLLPQRAWEALATIEHTILGDGLIKLELGYHRVSKVQDRIPTPEGFDAPGNLGDGDILILRNRIDAPLDRLGIKGGRLTLYGSLVSTGVTDPYTLQRRPFSGNSLFYGEVNFRQDLGKFAWGFNFYGNTRSTVYRRDELDWLDQTVPQGSIFAEYRPDAKTTLTFSLDDPFDRPFARKRQFFAPDRRSDQPYAAEIRHRDRHLIPAISFRRSFG